MLSMPKKTVKPLEGVVYMQKSESMAVWNSPLGCTNWHKQIRETEVMPQGKMLSNIVPVSRTIEVILSSQYLERSRRRYSSSNTVLGLTLCNTLEWNNNIKEIVTKAIKCLYILRVLKRAWIPSSYFLNVYFALIR